MSTIKKEIGSISYLAGMINKIGRTDTKKVLSELPSFEEKVVKAKSMHRENNTNNDLRKEKNESIVINKKEIEDTTNELML